jgi:hypothetical protein
MSSGLSLRRCRPVFLIFETEELLERLVIAEGLQVHVAMDINPEFLALGKSLIQQRHSLRFF